jgi:hypothetical protein
MARKTKEEIVIEWRLSLKCKGVVGKAASSSRAKEEEKRCTRNYIVDGRGLIAKRLALSFWHSFLNGRSLLSNYQPKLWRATFFWQSNLQEPFLCLRSKAF